MTVPSPSTATSTDDSNALRKSRWVPLSMLAGHESGAPPFLCAPSNDSTIRRSAFPRTKRDWATVGSQQLDRFDRHRTSRHVSAKDDQVNAGLLDLGQDGLQSRQVAMNVAQAQQLASHDFALLMHCAGDPRPYRPGRLHERAVVAGDQASRRPSVQGGAAREDVEWQSHRLARTTVTSAPVTVYDSSRAP